MRHSAQPGATSDPLRLTLLDLGMERAATVTELAEAFDRPDRGLGLVVRDQPFEEFHRAVHPGKRGDLVPRPRRIRPIGRLGQHGAHRRPDDRRRALLGADDPTHAEVRAASGVARLVALHRDHDQRDASGEAAHDCAEAAVRDHEVAARQQDAVRHLVLDAHVGWLGTERRRVAVAPDSYHQVDRLLVQAGEDRLVQPWRARHLGRAERRMHQRPTDRPGVEPGGRRPVARGTGGTGTVTRMTAQRRAAATRTSVSTYLTRSGVATRSIAYQPWSKW